MSWTTTKKNDALEEALKNAVADSESHHPILLFCSGAEEGVWSEKVYPAEHGVAIRVAAADKYGQLLANQDKDDVNIFIPGEDVKVEGPHYMENLQEAVVGGSSVATALASGIASLAMVLLRTFNDVEENDDNQNDKTKYQKFYKKAGILEVFKKMNSEAQGIKVSKLFPNDSSQLPKLWKLDEWKFD